MINFHMIVADVAWLVKARWRLLLAIVAAQSIATTWIDRAFMPPASDWLWLMLVAPAFYFTVVITCAALKDFRLLPGHCSKWRIAALVLPSALLQMLIYMLATGAGMLLLIVPGIILFVRWSLGLSILIVEKRGIWEALERSWLMTEGRWSLVAQLGCLTVMLFLPSALANLLYGGDLADSLPWLLVDHASSTAASTLLTLAAVALYRLLKSDPAREAVAEV